MVRVAERVVSFRFDTRSEILVLEPVFRSNRLYGTGERHPTEATAYREERDLGGTIKNPPLGRSFTGPWEATSLPLLYPGNSPAPRTPALQL